MNESENKSSLTPKPATKTTSKTASQSEQAETVNIPLDSKIALPVPIPGQSFTIADTTEMAMPLSSLDMLTVNASVDDSGIRPIDLNVFGSGPNISSLATSSGTAVNDATNSNANTSGNISGLTSSDSNIFGNHNADVSSEQNTASLSSSDSNMSSSDSNIQTDTFVSTNSHTDMIMIAPLEEGTKEMLAQPPSSKPGFISLPPRNRSSWESTAELLTDSVITAAADLEEMEKGIQPVTIANSQKKAIPSTHKAEATKASEPSVPSAQQSKLSSSSGTLPSAQSAQQSQQSKLAVTSSSLPPAKSAQQSKLAVTSSSLPPAKSTQQSQQSKLAVTSSSLQSAQQSQQSKLAASSGSLPSAQQLQQSKLVATSGSLPSAQQLQQSKLAASSGSLPSAQQLQQSKLAASSGSLPSAQQLQQSKLATSSGSLPSAQQSKLAASSGSLPSAQQLQQSKLAASSGALPSAQSARKPPLAIPQDIISSDISGISNISVSDLALSDISITSPFLINEKLGQHDSASEHSGSSIDVGTIVKLTHSSVALPQQDNISQQIISSNHTTASSDLTIPNLIDETVVSSGNNNLSNSSISESKITTKYQVCQELGRSGMGEISLWKDTHIQRLVVAKMLPKELSTHPSAVQRFWEEGQIAGQLEHPNIPPTYDLGVDRENRIFFTTKYIQGESLQSILDQIQEQPELRQDIWTLHRFLQIFQTICYALEYAHSKQVIHRNLRPESIMLGGFNEVTVVDWGLAKVIGQGQEIISEDSMSTLRTQGGLKTIDGQIVGTVDYMSPEQVRGDLEHLSAQSDIYSLGAILFEILTGEKTVESDQTQTLILKIIDGDIKKVPNKGLWGKIHNDLKHIVSKAMALEPQQRYQSCRELAIDIQRFLEGKPLIGSHDSYLSRFFKK